MSRLIRKILFVIILVIMLLPVRAAFAETLEERFNNLIGPKEQYNTMLSPVYLRNNTMEEFISTQSGELSLAQTDYVLPGRNGLDLEIKRLYKSGISNVQEMKVKYVNGAWVDYIHADANTTSFYEDRYNLGVGMRFSFPAIEIKKNEDGTSHKFLHTEAGDTYRLKGPTVINGTNTYLPETQTVKDVVVKEDLSFSNGQPDGTSRYVMVGNNGKKTWFTDDGRVIGISDRYGNTIKFEYATQNYSVDGVSRSKKLISTIIDTIGRIVTIEYREDYTFRVGSAENTHYGKEESWKESQNPNSVDSGDLKGKFQVLICLPGNRTIVYDKSAVLVGKNKNVIRTRLQRVYDVDGKPKYHLWYEQTDLGFTYTNGTNYSVYSRYENLVQVDFCKTNKINGYSYNTYTRGLADNGSAQYRKIFEKKELVKKDYDASKNSFLDRFACDTKDRVNYTYTNEADGCGFSGYNPNDEGYLKNTYRYYTKKTDMAGSTVTYNYNGLHELVSTEDRGENHREVAITEYDEMKFPKKKETLINNVVSGQETGQPVRKTENYRYDEFGNLTNYTGPVANRDSNGYPTDIEHTVVYSYAYDRYHIPILKTWKNDSDTTCQIKYDVDARGDVTKETRVMGEDPAGWVVTGFSYDPYGNMTVKEVRSPEKTYLTNYEYGVGLNGTDHKGAYLTREYSLVDGKEVSKRYAYDPNTGGITAETDGNSNRTDYQYDILDRVEKVTRPDNTIKQYGYRDYSYADKEIEYTDPDGVRLLYRYDTAGDLLEASVYDRGVWNILKKLEYDSNRNKIKETDSNGHSIWYEYDSKNRPVRKAYYEKGSTKKAEVGISYTNTVEGSSVLLVTITDEEGFVQKFYYDTMNRLVKSGITPDNKVFYNETYSYDYLGNKVKQTAARGNETAFKNDAFGRLICKTDALGNVTRYTYNAMDKVLSVEEPGDKVTEYLYDGLGRVIMEKTCEKGSDSFAFTQYEYDDADNVKAVRYGGRKGGTDTVLAETLFDYDSMNLATDEYKRVDAENTVHIHYEYDGAGRKTRMVEYADKGETKYRVYNYTYDFAGRLVSEEGAYRAPDGSGSDTEYGSYSRKYEYDYAGNMIKQEILGDRGYSTSIFTYDYRNKLVQKEEPYTAQKTKITKYNYDRKGNLLAEIVVKQGEECTTAYAYDGLARVTAQVSPSGGITTYIYDETNNLVKKILPSYYGKPLDSAPGTEYSYDALNRQYKITAFDGSTKEVLVYREFDKRGNVTKEADGAGYNASNPKASIGAVYEYDIYGNVIKHVSAQTAVDNTKNGTAFFSTRKTFDAMNRVLSEEDAYGNVTLYSYYMDGKLKEKSLPDGSKESFVYDLTGKIEEERTDRASNVIRTFNNVFDRPYRIEYPDATAETFTYSRDGRLIESSDKAGNAAYYEYSPAGDMTSKKQFESADADYNRYKLVSYTYYETGNMQSSETFEYASPKCSGLPTVSTSAGDRTVYEYDKAGKLTRVAGPNGRETVNAYDINGELIKQLQKVNGSLYDVKRYGYDFMSRLISESILVKSEDIQSDYLLGARFDREYSDRVVSETTYTYYANGKLRSKKDAEGNTTSYEYDYDGKVIKKTDALLKSTLYWYDLRGNIAEEKSARGVSTYYDYDGMNRLIRRKIPAAEGGQAVTRYIYDAMDNLVKQVQPNDYDGALDTPELLSKMPGVSYTYDCMNRRISVIAPDGHITEMFKYDANGNIAKTVDGLRYNGSMDASGGTAYEYDGLNRVIAVIDAAGNKTAYEYNILGNLTKQTDARGNTTLFEYNGDGTLARAAYADGGTVENTYDGLGRLLAHKDQRGNITAYAYNAFGKLKMEKDPYGIAVEYRYDLNGNPVYVKDKRGSITISKYDALNRVTEKRMPLEIDANGSVAASIEKYAYDEAGNILKKTLTGTKDKFDSRETNYTYYDNNLVKTVTDLSGAYTRYAYDRNGNTVKVEKLRDAGNYDIEKYEYESMNRLVKDIRLVDETDIFNAAAIPNIDNLRDAAYPGKIALITAYEYDILGNKVKEMLPKAFEYSIGDAENMDGYTIKYIYDALNRLEKIIKKHNGEEVYVQYRYDETGNRVMVRDERGFETTYEYDSMNRLASSTDPMGGIFSYAYDLAGSKLTETNAKGNTISYTYDKLGRPLTVTDPYGVTITTNSYDPNGNLIMTKDPKGYAKTYAYDLTNRVVEVIDPEAADKGTYTEKYEYNQYGEKIKTTDALGNATSYEYDTAGRLKKVTDALGVSTRYGYDKAGNKLYMTDGRDKTTSYACGSFGKITQTTDAEGKSIEYGYDLSGNTASMTDKNGNVTVYTYNNRNFITGKICANTKDRVSYTYDAAGNRTGMADESGTYVYIYDKNNKLSQAAKDGAVQVSYTYDEIGNIKAVTDTKGKTVTYTYDKSSRMETVTFEGSTTTYAYDANGNRVSVSYGGGVKEEYTYDKDNRLKALANKKPDGSVISTYSYTYDLAGREATKTDSYGTTTYTYDAAGRVTKVEAPGKTTAYAYDSAGNRISLQETYTSDQPAGFIDEAYGNEIQYILKKSQYVYSNANRLIKLVEEMYGRSNKIVLTKTVQYLYDANGNQVSEYAGFTHPGSAGLRKTIEAGAYGDMQQEEPDPLIERTVNTFDGFNRLKKAEKIGDGVRTLVEYAYSGDDLRVQKVVKKSDNGYAPVVTSFLYDRQHVILETDGNGNTITRYIRGINYIAQYTGGSLAYFLYNGHGDVVQTAAASGVAENQYDYDVFGNPTLTIEQAACSIRYAGEYLDNETGLYYLRARYYDPYIGRFTSEDSYWGEDANPLSLNLYTYAHNNPIRFIDPSGHRATESAGFGGPSSKSTQDEIITLMAKIDALKKYWWDQEKAAGKTKADIKSTRENISSLAGQFREELLELEQNKELKDLIKADQQGKVGAWKEYKVVKTIEQMRSSTDYDPKLKSQLKQSARDLYLETKLHKDIYGIDEKDISRSLLSEAEKAADALVKDVVVKLIYEKAGVFEVGDDGSIVFKEKGITWKYVGMDAGKISDSIVRASYGARSREAWEKIQNSGLMKKLNNAAGNKELKLTADELAFLYMADPHGVRDYLYTRDRKLVHEVYKRLTWEEPKYYERTLFGGWQVTDRAKSSAWSEVRTDAEYMLKRSDNFPRDLVSVLEPAIITAGIMVIGPAVLEEVGLLLSSGAEGAKYYLNRLGEMGRQLSGGGPSLQLAGNVNVTVAGALEGQLIGELGADLNVVAAGTDVLSRYLLFADKFPAIGDALRGDPGNGGGNPEGAGKVPNKVTDLAKDMKGWLGKDARVITNKNGDKVFMSGDGTKRIRFDINNTSPHNNPHGHVEELVNGKWVKSGPIYPTDVPHN